MSIEAINNLKEEFNLPIEVCNGCLGDGEITLFCGHYTVVECENCKGKGYIHVCKMCEKSKKTGI
jgi:RecJ-like exonuclease